jgi:hypothetical protein
MTRTLSFAVGLLLTASIASAQFGDVGFSGGYSHIYPQRTSGLNFAKDGGYFDGDFAWRLPGQVPFMLGFGLTWNGTWSSTNQPVGFGNNFFGTTWLYSDIDNFAFEPRLALKLRIPGLNGLEIRPRIGAGPMYTYYAIDSAQVFNNGVFINTAYHSGAAFEVRPAIQVGYNFGGASVGMESSYSAAWGSFGALGDTMQELRIGAYVRFRF